jgi:hypothetical protein
MEMADAGHGANSHATVAYANVDRNGKKVTESIGYPVTNGVIF